MRRPDLAVIVSGVRLVVDTSVAFLALALLGPSNYIQIGSEPWECTEMSRGGDGTCGGCLQQGNCSVCITQGYDCACITAQNLHAQGVLEGPGDRLLCGRLAPNDVRLSLARAPPAKVQSGETPRDAWSTILLPLRLGYMLLAVVHFCRCGYAVRQRHMMRQRARQAGPPHVHESSPSSQLLETRNVAEAMYRAAFFLSICISAQVLASQLGRWAATGRDVNIPVVMVALWTGWGIEMVVAVTFQVHRDRMIREHELSDEHKKIKIRESQVIFFNNLILTLIARKADGAYECTWALLFIPTWIIFAFTALTIIIVVIAQIGLCIASIAETTNPEMRTMLRRYTTRLALITVLGTASLVCHFCFWLNLTLALDEKAHISYTMMLLPFILKFIPDFLTLVAKLYYGEGMFDLAQARANTAAGVAPADDAEWKREMEEYSLTAPRKLVRSTSCLYKVIQDFNLSATDGEDEPVIYAKDISTCKICFDNIHDTILLPCGHAMCRECTMKSVNVAPHECPFCKTRVKMIADMPPGPPPPPGQEVTLCAAHAAADASLASQRHDGAPGDTESGLDEGLHPSSGGLHTSSVTLSPAITDAAEP